MSAVDKQDLNDLKMEVRDDMHEVKEAVNKTSSDVAELNNSLTGFIQRTEILLENQASQAALHYERMNKIETHIEQQISACKAEFRDIYISKQEVFQIKTTNDYECKISRREEITDAVKAVEKRITKRFNLILVSVTFGCSCVMAIVVNVDKLNKIMGN